MNSKIVLYVSLSADVIIAVSKFVGAAFTGSASMFAEAIHSVIDSISQIMLIWGVKRSTRPADTSRPFGYGRDLYFWSLIVSIIIFVLGGCISIIQGYAGLNRVTFEGNPVWNYAILGIALIFNSISFLNALKAFNTTRNVNFWRALVKSTDSSIVIVLLGDIGDLIGILIALLGIYFGRLLGVPSIDGYASMAIGILLIVISGFLIRESSSLLIGETINVKMKHDLIEFIEKDFSVHKVKSVHSIYESPNNALVIINTQFKNKIEILDLYDTVDRITIQIKHEFPQITQVFFVPLRMIK